MHLADGYYRASGKSMLAFTSIGPGQMNTVVGMATAYVDSTAVTVNVLKGDFDAVFPIFVDLLQHPAFRQEKIDLAKTQARTAQTASETLATDKNGEYTEVSVANLEKVEPTLSDKSAAVLIKAEGTATTFAVESETVATKDKFKIARGAEGVVTRTCTVPAGANQNGCPVGGKW